MDREFSIKIFGLGVSLLLAAGAWLHLLQLHLGIIWVLALFIFLLFAIDRAVRWPLLYGLVYLIIVVGTVFQYLKHMPSGGVVICDLVSLVFLLAVLAVPSILLPVYDLWMKATHFIGTVVTAIVLSVVYFILFTPVSFLLKLMGKDHLERKIDRAAGSYWHRRTSENTDKERYLQQF